MDSLVRSVLGADLPEPIDFEGTGFEAALKKVIAVRKQRQKLYGDSWKTVDAWEHLAFLKEKVRRLETLTFDATANNYEGTEDTLIDIINYALFALQNSIDKKRK